MGFSGTTLVLVWGPPGGQTRPRRTVGRVSVVLQLPYLFQGCALAERTTRLIPSLSWGF